MNVHDGNTMSGMSKKVTVKDGPSHPKYSVMITEAMKALKSRTGSSRTALLKHIKGVHDVGDEKKATMYPGYQVGYVFTYLGMYTYLFQKLGM